MYRLQKFLEDENKFFCFDVDDILLDTTAHWINLINNDKECITILKQKNKYPLKIEDWTSWNAIPDLLGDITFKFHDNNEIYEKYILTKYSIELIRLVKDIIGANRIKFITASRGNKLKLKEDILIKEFGIDKKYIYHTSDKTNLYIGNFVLDDAIHNLQPILEDIDTIGVILNKPWNKDFKHSNVNRIECLQELILKIKEVI